MALICENILELKIYESIKQISASVQHNGGK